MRHASHENSAAVVRFALVVACVAAIAAALLAVAAGAATYTVTTFEEDELDNGNCTLREALRAALDDSTHDQCVGDVGPDEIVLAGPGTYALQDGNLSGAARTLVVRGAAGSPRESYLVDLGDSQRFLTLQSGFDLTLENLTLFDGHGSTRGGAILAVDSNLALRDVVVVSCRSDAEGGGIQFEAHGSERLDLERVRFDSNRIAANQAFGGALHANLQAGTPSVRVVRSEFVDNAIVSASGSFNRAGGAIAIQDFAGADVELRHLVVVGNTIDAPSFARGAGLYLRQPGGSLLAEDLRFEDNGLFQDAATNGALAVEASLADLESAEIRRLVVRGSFGGATRAQAVVQAQGLTPLVLSDAVVGPGAGVGLFLATSGTGCTLVAGNLTVAGNGSSGLRLAEGSCPLRVENSIVSANATLSGSNLELSGGTPEVSAETMVGGDPEFVDAASGDFRLLPTSAAIGGGDADFESVGPFDVAHGPRIADGEVDLGAWEDGAIFADGFDREDVGEWMSATGN